jgi:UDP-N-acetylmuramoyl-tripeptide--D-alanyl-D-alanine ligase
VIGLYATMEPVTERASPLAPSGDEPRPGLTADEIAQAAGGHVLVASSRLVLGAAVDSREVVAGNLFVALPGEHVDGHDFVDRALDAGAAAVLVSRPPGEAVVSGRDASVIVVQDPLRAFGAVAAAWRRRFDPLVVGVTGSLAKTSTKEAIATVLSAVLVTLKNEGNKNNEIGLPITLMGLRPDHQAAVLEMGMYVGGEIADLATMARPEIGVVTAVQPVHLSRIGSIEAIERAKGELVEALPPDGVAVLNADDPRVARMASRTAARAISYGFASDADVRGEAVESAGVDGMRFRLVAGGTTRDVAIPTLGRLAVHNALAGAAVGLAAGMSVDEIVRALAAGWSAPHRAVLVRTAGPTIVDDSYNASPAAVEAALELLAGLPGRHIAVLGEMLELGDESEPGHEQVGAAAAAVVDRLVVVGDGATGIARGARDAGLAGDAILEVADRDAAFEWLVDESASGDVVLVKASRGIGLDMLVDRLVEHFGAPRGAAAPDAADRR